MQGIKVWDKVALVLVIVGAINWGLIGFFAFDLVAAVFGGQGEVLSRIVYAIVGLAGLWCLKLLAVPTSRRVEHRQHG